MSGLCKPPASQGLGYLKPAPLPAVVIYYLRESFQRRPDTSFFPAHLRSARPPLSP